MPIYSHSQLSVYEQCPLKFKIHYLDKIRREEEQGIEAFLGTMVHETLKKCYDDIKLTRLNTLNELLLYYENLWQKNWNDAIVITKKDITREHYRALGKIMIEGYYKRYSPFNQDKTVGTEMLFNFSLDDENKYRLRGYIDRLSSPGNNIFEIHDYKTGAHLPIQAEVDSDRQLGLYQVGVQNKWPATKNIKLIWHYMAFDTEMVSSRSGHSISRLVAETKNLIDEIESTVDFMPKESALCDWCEYPDLCPVRKHSYVVEALPANEYLAEPGVALVNKYVELKAKADEIGSDIGKLKEAIIEYARKEGLSVIQGSSRNVRVKFDKKLKFPGKNDEERKELNEILTKEGKWQEVSQLDLTELEHVIEEGRWDKDLIEKIMKYSRIEETSAIYLTRMKGVEEFSKD